MVSAVDWEGSDVGLGVLRRTGTGEPAVNVALDVPWDVGVLTVPAELPPVALEAPLHTGMGRTCVRFQSSIMFQSIWVLAARSSLRAPCRLDWQVLLRCPCPCRTSWHVHGFNRCRGRHAQATLSKSKKL